MKPPMTPNSKLRLVNSTLLTIKSGRYIEFVSIHWGDYAIYIYTTYKLGKF